MRFRVTRTSNAIGEAQPCEEAMQGVYIERDWRNVNDPEKIPAYAINPQQWYERGTNHRVIDGCIVRDMGVRDAWFVEIDTLEQLMRFNQKYGDIVVRQDRDSDYPLIEIYDTYRE